jgi:hypothetical protein
MSAVTEHLQQRGSAFELLSHRQADTSTDEARALGIDAGEVLKTLAVRTGPGYALAVIPASCRLDLLGGGRDGLADHLPLEWGEQLVASSWSSSLVGGWGVGQPVPALARPVQDRPDQVRQERSAGKRR